MTPDVVVDEIGEELSERVRELGLEVLTTGPSTMELLGELRAKYRGPGDADLHGLLLAREDGSRLLTGDGHLRQAAESEGVEVSGLLWLMDRLVDERVIPPGRAASALQEIVDHGARLPEDECEKRLLKWHTEGNG